MSQAPYSSYWPGRPVPLACGENLHQPAAPLAIEPPACCAKGLRIFLKVSFVCLFFIILGMAAIPLITS